MVRVLLAVPLLLPVVGAEERVVLHRGHEGVARGDGVKDRQTGGLAHRVRVRWQLGALEDDRAELGVGLHGVEGELHDVRRGRREVNPVPHVDGMAEPGHGQAVDDDEALVLEGDAARLIDLRAHGIEVGFVGREDGDLLVLGVGGGDSGRRAQRRHEDRLLGVLAGLVLEVEEETAVGGDCARGRARREPSARSRRKPRTARHVLVLVEILDRLHEALHDVVRQGSPRLRDGVLAHCEGQARDNAVENIVRVGPGVVDVAQGRRVLVVQPDDAEGRRRLLGLCGEAASAQVLGGQRASQSEGAEHARIAGAGCEVSGTRHRGERECVSSGGFDGKCSGCEHSGHVQEEARICVRTEMSSNTENPSEPKARHKL
eukprot:scaffold59807_cov66-Phaeocystis_antarctica.AAC.1